jgi:hypothetical protein
MAAGHGPEVLDDGAVTMGHQDRSSAVPGADGDPRPLPPVALTGQPGTRAPTCRSPSTTAGPRPWTCTAAAWCSWRAWRAPGGSGRWPACRSRWTPTASGRPGAGPRAGRARHRRRRRPAGPPRRLRGLAQHPRGRRVHAHPADHPECTSVKRTSVGAALPRRGGGAVAAVARCRRLCATRREEFLPVQARQVVGAAC